MNSIFNNIFYETNHYITPKSKARLYRSTKPKINKKKNKKLHKIAKKSKRINRGR